MTRHDTDHHDDRHHIDPELRPLDEALDDLARRTRAQAPDNLERRLLDHTRPHLRGEARTDPPDTHAPPVVARIGWRASPALKLAAAIAIAATATLGAFLIANALTPPKAQTMTPTPTVRRTSDELLDDIDAELQDWLADLETIDLAESDDAPADPWSIPDDLSLLEEESS